MRDTSEEPRDAEQIAAHLALLNPVGVVLPRPCPGASCDVLRCSVEGCALTRAPLVVPPGSRV